jgi:biopolymer transport protein ExbB/TolQ
LPTIKAFKKRGGSIVITAVMCITILPLLTASRATPEFTATLPRNSASMAALKLDLREVRRVAGIMAALPEQGRCRKRTIASLSAKAKANLGKNQAAEAGNSAATEVMRKLAGNMNLPARLISIPGTT